MKIEKSTLKTSFDELRPGSVFTHDKYVYMKVIDTRIDEVYAIDLENGMTAYFNDYDIVFPISTAKLVM